MHKATGYSAKLLKKADQCRAVCTCSHLYWQDEVCQPLCVAFPDCVVRNCFHLCWQGEMGLVARVTCLDCVYLRSMHLLIPS